jgi:hypothetical protein
MISINININNIDKKKYEISIIINDNRPIIPRIIGYIVICGFVLHYYLKKNNKIYSISQITSLF